MFFVPPLFIIHLEIARYIGDHLVALFKGKSYFWPNNTFTCAEELLVQVSTLQTRSWVVFNLEASSCLATLYNCLYIISFFKKRYLSILEAKKADVYSQLTRQLKYLQVSFFYFWASCSLPSLSSHIYERLGESIYINKNKWKIIKCDFCVAFPLQLNWIAKLQDSVVKKKNISLISWATS